MKGFCYLCGFLLLKEVSLCFLCLVTSPLRPCTALQVSYYSFTSRNMVLILTAMTARSSFISLVGLPAMSLSLKLLVKYRLPVLALALVCTASSYSCPNHQNSCPQHTSSLPLPSSSLFSESPSEIHEISQQALSIALGF